MFRYGPGHHGPPNNGHVFFLSAMALVVMNLRRNGLQTNALWVLFGTMAMFLLVPSLVLNCRMVLYIGFLSAMALVVFNLRRNGLQSNALWVPCGAMATFCLVPYLGH